MSRLKCEAKLSFQYLSISLVHTFMMQKNAGLTQNFLRAGYVQMADSSNVRIMNSGDLLGTKTAKNSLITGTSGDSYVPSSAK